MAFNPYYQIPYYPQPMPDNLMQMRQQQMMQPAPPPVPQNPVATGGVQWVSSEQEARGYLIAPNSAVALWDSTAPTVYLKQSDASGKPTLKIYVQKRPLTRRKSRAWNLSPARSLTRWRRLWAK